MWILSLFCALVILAISYWVGRLIPEDKILQAETSRSFKISALSIAIIFLMVAYITKPMYYFPTNNGHLGDNYYHMGWALEDENYLKPHHILYPLIPGKLVSWSQKLGFLDKNDPFFYEKVYRLASLPVRLGICFAILIFGLYIFKITKSIINALLAFFFLSTSYGFWVWGLQSSAIGLSMAFSLLGLVIGSIWYIKRNKLILFLLGFCASLAVFIHISQFYFALGIFLSVILIISLERKGNWSSKIKEILPFLASAVPLAVLFYLIEASLWNETNPIKIFYKVSEVDYLGGFNLSERSFMSIVDLNVMNSIYQITNYDLREFYPFWKPEIIKVQKTILDNIFLLVHLASFLAIFLFIFWNYKKLSSPVAKGLIIFSSIISILFFLGFVLRPAGSYAVAATPSHLVLISSLLYSIKGPQVQIPRAIIIITFAISGIFYNTTSTANIYRGRGINEHPYYIESSNIINSLKSNEKAVYYRHMDLTYYPNASLHYYYQFKFVDIEWRWDEWGDLTKLEVEIRNQLVSKKKRVFIGPEMENILKNGMFKTLKLEPISNKIKEIKDI